MLTKIEQSLIEAVLRERECYMATTEGTIQRNRATELAEIMQRLLAKIEELKCCGNCRACYVDGLNGDARCSRKEPKGGVYPWERCPDDWEERDGI